MSNILKVIEVILIILALTYIKKYKWFDTLSSPDEEKLLQQNVMSNSTRNISSSSCFVAVVAKLANESSRTCGGSRISNRYILTAAHCLEGSESVTIILIETAPGDGAYTIASSTFKIHPKWQPRILLNDVALIEISPLERAHKIQQLVGFPGKKKRDRIGTLYGWEKNETSDSSKNKTMSILRTHEVVVIDNEECAESFGGLIRKTNICTKALSYQNGCHGFSGSPLLANGRQIGIVSFGTSKCNSGYPTVHTRVSKYREMDPRKL
ncbi:hypothetical protein NQ318_011224 [Aromia moschata]|uniref:Peptidase S1 domain-containing protein n=1 Tax=Aromia moschata TaxID=1265417 RepID=A0AAV8YG70_9CUCU|nr:hypothetical protein NQ318_011224 [Aromia moschata]